MGSNRGQKKGEEKQRSVGTRANTLAILARHRFFFYFFMIAHRYCLRGEEGGGVNRIQLDVATAAIWERFQQTVDRDVSRARFAVPDEHLLGVT